MWEGWFEYMGGSDGSEGGSGEAYHTQGTPPGTTNFTFSEGFCHVKNLLTFVFVFVFQYLLYLYFNFCMGG